MKHTDKTIHALAKLATALPSTTDILRGSLLQRRIRHRSGCAVCARGEGHLISVLTVSYPGGRTKQISLRPEQKPIVEQWLRNYRNIKAALQRICELNHQRLRAERNSDRCDRSLPHSRSPTSNCSSRVSISTLSCEPSPRSSINISPSS